MERILKLVTINYTGTNSTPKLTAEYILFRILDIPIPPFGSVPVYFLLYIRTKDYTYIGECKFIIQRFYQHNSGHGSSSTSPANRIPYYILGYICGFNGLENPLGCMIEKK